MALVELIYDKEKYREKIKRTLAAEIETIFKINGELLGGSCLKSEGGVYGDDCDLYGFFEEMLTLLPYLLSEGKYYRFSKNSQNFNLKEVKSWIDINNVKNPNLACWMTLHFQFNTYIFELDKDKDELIIHYYNDPLSYTDCEEYKNKDSGIVRVPLKEFTKEIVKLAEDYLELVKNSEIPEEYDWRDDLQEYIKDVKKYYKERYGEEL
jgi:hypothetical protein